MKENTKLQEIRDFMEKGEWENAIKMAASFQRLGPQKEAIKAASDSLTNPNFYKQLGLDPDLLLKAGIEALKQRFNKSWDEIQKKKNGN